MSERVAVVIRDNDRILLMHRAKQGREYYAVPGGSVEAGETLEEACLREAREETGLTIELHPERRSFLNQGRQEHVFLATNYRGEVRLGGPELERQSPDNQYRLEWVPLERLAELTVFPAQVLVFCADWLKRRGG